MRFADLPPSGWVRRLMAERKFRKAVIRAGREEYVTITAIWDRGYAWSIWKQYGPHGGPKTWVHSDNGMLSQMSVPVEVSGETFLHFDDPRYSYTDSRRIEIPEAAHISFWDWGEDWGEDEGYCPSLKNGKRCRKTDGRPCPFRPAAGGIGLNNCDINEGAVAR